MPSQLVREFITRAHHKIVANPVTLKSDDALKPASRGVRTICEGTSHVPKVAFVPQKHLFGSALVSHRRMAVSADSQSAVESGSWGHTSQRNFL